MKTYRVGVIGNTQRGGYGHNLDIAFLELDNVEMVAVSDPDDTGRQSAATRLGLPPARQYSDYHDMLRREELDLVCIGPRVLGQRREMVTAATQVSAKGIFCEKPFAATLEDSEAMLQACASSGTKLTLAHVHRVNPLILQLKKLLADGFIGQVWEMEIWAKQDPRGGGLELVVLGTHMLDMLLHLAGHPRWVQAFIMQDGRDAGPGDVHEGDEEIGATIGNYFRATYAFDNGVLGHFSSRASDGRLGPHAGLMVSGSEGVLIFRSNNPALLHCPHPVPPPFSDASWQTIATPPQNPPLSANALLIQDLIAAIEEDREPVASGQEGGWVTEMIMGVYAAHRHGRVALPLAQRSHPLAEYTA